MKAEWSRIASVAADEARAFEAALAHPRATQVALLGRILAANAGSPFGQAHGFAAIGTIEAFRDAVAPMTYEDLQASIERGAAGDPQLTGERPVAYELTGGSAGGGKLIPCTPATLEAFRRAILPWMNGMIGRHPSITAGRFYATISPATRAPACTPDGTPIGLGSDAAYLGAALVEPFMALLAVPPELGAITDPGEWQVATLAALVEADDLTLVSLWSPTFLMALVEALPRRFDAVSARLSPAARARLDAGIRSGAIDAEMLWPHLACISCWADGPSASFSAALGDLFPQAAIDPKGVLATESPITLPWGDQGACVPALTSAVIEFVSHAGEPLLCDELEPGETYRVLLTTPGGLYRYDIGDMLTCTGMRDGVPDLAFVGRSGLASDLVGEKLTDAFVSGILARSGSSAIVAPRIDGRGYELVVDADLSPAAIEAALCDNPQYAYARRMGQLEPLRLRKVPGLSHEITARGLAEGRRMGDIKVSGLWRRPCEESAA